MSITFKCEADMILWTFAKLLVTFNERQNLFAAQSIWWIAALVQLDPALRYFINYQNVQSIIQSNNDVREPIRASFETEISSTSLDIQRQLETDEEAAQVLSQYQADLLRHTRKGRVNPQLLGVLP